MFTKCVWTILTAWGKAVGGVKCRLFTKWYAVTSSVKSAKWRHSKRWVLTNVFIFSRFENGDQNVPLISCDTVSCEVHMTSRVYTPFRGLHDVWLQSVPILTPRHCHSARSDACRVTYSVAPSRYNSAQPHWTHFCVRELKKKSFYMNEHS